MPDCSPEAYRRTWESKPALRAVYRDLYRRLEAACLPGRTLELGGGSGNLKRVLKDVVSTDIQAAPWLDAVADAQALPFANASFDNVVMVDVLHHLSFLRRFFREATRVLRPGGRIVMVEPAITPLSWLFYALLHDEPVRMGADPLAEAAATDPDNPWDANQALPTLLLRRRRAAFERAFPDLRVVRVAYLSLFAYPLSGGFKPWSLLPGRLAGPLLKAEDWLMPLLGPLMAYRLLAVIERRSTP